MSRDNPTPRITLTNFNKMKLICKYYTPERGWCSYNRGDKSWSPKVEFCKIRTCPIWQRWLKSETKTLEKILYSKNKS